MSYEVFQLLITKTSVELYNIAYYFNRKDTITYTLQIQGISVLIDFSVDPTFHTWMLNIASK